MKVLKNIALCLFMAVSVAGVSTSVYAEEKKPDVKTEKVCIKDEKTKKETCKTIKIHKKLEGTTVPTKK